jgi:hypothetical protein
LSYESRLATFESLKTKIKQLHFFLNKHLAVF